MRRPYTVERATRIGSTFFFVCAKKPKSNLLITAGGAGGRVINDKLEMNKKIIIPVVLSIVICLGAIFTCFGGSKIVLEWDKVPASSANLNSTELKVYVENSGSMDAYMCPGSSLKDAVFDYVSDLKKYSKSCSLNYINSQIIPYHGNLESYIKDLTPSAFAKAGGNRSNTDLREILGRILKAHTPNSISIFVSDCILDIPESATDFFGNCQISIKNSFNDALAKNKYLGVEIIQLESKFNGYWYCGKNSMKLSNVKRPYYMWIIGDQRLLAAMNEKVDVNSIIGGIKNYCAYAPSQAIPFDIEKRTFALNHSDKIKPQLLVNLNASLQDEISIRNIVNYKSSNPTKTIITSVQKIDSNSPYSHVVELEMSNPETIKSESITFSYPAIANWVVSANDSTGIFSKNMMDKTTGILYLIKGVSEAYKNNRDFGSVIFKLKNK